jgi:hypothetical protein
LILLFAADILIIIISLLMLCRLLITTPLLAISPFHISDADEPFSFSPGFRHFSATITPPVFHAGFMLRCRHYAIRLSVIDCLQMLITAAIFAFR